MKVIILISLLYLECISGLSYSAVFTLDKIDLAIMNKFFKLDSPNQLLIRELDVKKELTEDDKLSVDYRMELINGEPLQSNENASFCGDDAGTEGGSIAEAVRKILGIQEMNCPIPQQKNEMVAGVVDVEIQNTEVDTNCERFYVYADLKVNRAKNPLCKIQFSVSQSQCVKKEDQE